MVKINDQKLVDYSFNWFISLIKNNRNIDQNVIDLVSDGRTLTGGMAMDLGLIDGIGSEKEALKYLDIFKDHPYIFNLGHGVLPETDPNMMDYLVKTVKNY